MLLSFFALRGLNLYGDPKPWSIQPSAVMTGLSFLNVSKYPPSLAYALATLGPALILLPRMEKLGGLAGTVLANFGRTPLFFYVTHLYLGAAVVLGLMARLAIHPTPIASPCPGSISPGSRSSRSSMRPAAGSPISSGAATPGG